MRVVRWCAGSGAYKNICKQALAWWWCSSVATQQGMQVRVNGNSVIATLKRWW